jgi:hypothetical protein
MTDTSNLETRLSRFLGEEAPARAPERLIDSSRRRIAETKQNRRFGRPAWRLRSSILTPATVAGAVAVVIVAVAFASLYPSAPSLGTGPGVSSPSPTAAASPTASASATASPSASPCATEDAACLGPLEPGTHGSSSFLPAVHYTVPGGWAKTGDVRGELDLAYEAGGQYTYPDGLTFHDGISIFRAPVAESTTSRAPKTGVGTSARDLAQWLVGHADLVATTPAPVSIGGASGYRLTLSLPTGPRTAPDHCTADHGEPRCESLFLSSDPAATYGFGLVGPETAVVYLLDMPSGDTVMVVIDDVDGVDQPKLVAAATPIVESLSFSP